MTGFLAELGKKLAERWVAALVLPGALFVSLAVVAGLLGHRRWADAGLLWQRLDQFTGTGQQGSRMLLLVLALLVASAGAGLAARALGRPVERALSGRWPRPLAPLSTALTDRRNRRWHALDAAAEDPRKRLRRNAISLAEPRFPTWLGDRLAAAMDRVWKEYGLDGSSWSRFWLLLPESTRGQLAEARQRLDDATALGGWAVLYVALGAVWWPSAVLGCCLGLIAWRRARVTGEVYADLVEAAYDVHLPDLLDRLADDGGLRPVNRQLGMQLTERFHKGF
ncbi:hypothetical protein [Amycolatopsis sp. CA-230715]|uniref:hypothetical protein n=1 Tax=Amycolatopsis sp. CA-230715 TaxID=2745196 RepID=UPI001C00ED9F|nr:hypothetical protein [Amycolatopsis sp. CA-230715]QWF84914.1 hypothetical protein HUW46_08366 [Amycolatopsis sp. CA-230715]